MSSPTLIQPPRDEDSARTARIIGLDLADDGVLLVRATCDVCRRTVLHGAGSDLNAPVLGTRVVHCRCREDESGAVYTLIDPHRVVPHRLRVLHRQLPDFLEHQAVATHRRQVEEAEQTYRRVLAETRDLPPGDPARRRLRMEASAALDAAQAALPEAVGR